MLLRTEITEKTEKATGKNNKSKKCMKEILWSGVCNYFLLLGSELE